MRRIQLILGIGIVAGAIMWPIITNEVDVALPEVPDYFLEPVEYIPGNDASHKATIDQQALNLPDRSFPILIEIPLL